MPPALQRRRERVGHHLDVGTGRGLEVGPLCSPLVTRTEGDVWYVDVQTTEELRDHYRGDPTVPPEEIVEVDAALYQHGHLRSIAEATAGIGPFDWAVASHVIEHVPDLVEWLRDMAASLVDGGRLVLVVPDRRYTFDARRPATTVGQLLAAHEARDQRPCVRAIYDHHREVVTVSAHAAWHGARPGPEARVHDLAYVQSLLHRLRSTDDYIDCHVWVFTPAELVGQLHDLAALGMLDFVVEAVQPTPVSELDFLLTLRRLPRSATAQQRAAAFAEGFPQMPDEAGPAHWGVLPAGLELHPITPREIRLIAMKRMILGAVPRWRERIRR